MKKIIIGLAIIVFFILVLLVLAPAKAIFPYITDKVTGLTISHPQGTVWSASSKQIQFKNLALNNVSLSTNPLYLIAGKLASTIEVQDQELKIKGQFVLGNSAQQVEDLKYELDASWLNQFLKSPINGLEGNISGVIEEYHSDINQQTIKRVNGNGSWHDAVIHYPNTILELGDFNYQLTTNEQNQIRINVLENKGVLDLKGYIDFGLDKSYQLNLNTQTELPENIKRWLTAFGKVQNNRIHIVWNSRLQ